MFRLFGVWVGVCWMLLFPAPGRGAVGGAGEISAATRARVAEARLLTQVFPVERVVRFQDGVHVIGYLGPVVWVGKTLFVQDLMQHLVYRCDLDGRILGVLGATGQGPGEYQVPLKLAAVWGNQVALTDSSGAMLVYAEDGTHQFTLRGGNGVVIPRARFAWPTQDRLYANNFMAYSPDRTLNRIMDHTDLAHPKLVAAWETRHPVERCSRSHLGYNGFCLAGDRVWSAIPYENRIRIFTPEGKLVRSFVPGGDIMAFEDFCAAAAKKPKNIFAEMGKDFELVHRLDYAGGLVLAQTSRGYRVYDKEGTALSSLMYRTGQVLGCGDDRIFTEIPLLDDESYYLKAIPQEHALLKAQGFDWTQPGDAPILRIGKLVTAEP